MASRNPTARLQKDSQVSKPSLGRIIRSHKSCQTHNRRRRKRSKAALQEKERLKVFNQALVTLQKVLPVRLPKGRKLHKKQTLQLASCYIQFLRGCLDGTHNWNDRHRFLWFTGGRDEEILNAIDEAAASVEKADSRNNRRKRDERDIQKPIIFKDECKTSTDWESEIFLHSVEATASFQDDGMSPSTSSSPHFIGSSSASNVLDEVIQDLDDMDFCRNDITNGQRSHHFGMLPNLQHPEAVPKLRTSDSGTRPLVPNSCLLSGCCIVSGKSNANCSINKSLTFQPV